MGWNVERPYRITLTLHARSNDRDIKRFIKLMQLFSKVSGRCLFRCELGYRVMDGFDNLNFVTEKGFVPFELTVYAEKKSRRDRILNNYLRATKAFESQTQIG